METPKKEKKPGVIGKLRESTDDRDEQIAILSTFVRLGILIWSGAILTLAYVKPPEALMIPEQKFDPTFIASVFTGVLATFGVQTAKKNENGKVTPGAVSKEEVERMVAQASRVTPDQPKQ